MRSCNWKNYTGNYSIKKSTNDTFYTAFSGAYHRRLCIANRCLGKKQKREETNVCIFLPAHSHSWSSCDAAGMEYPFLAAGAYHHGVAFFDRCGKIVYPVKKTQHHLFCNGSAN